MNGCWLHRLRRLRADGGLWLALRIAAFAICAPALARLSPPRLGRLLVPVVASTAPAPARVAQIIGYVEAIFGLGTPAIRPSCLTRGLTLYYFLRRAGVEVELCFGLGRVGGGFAGHCWLVRDGEPFLEKIDPRPTFAPWCSMPGGDPTPARASTRGGS